jgi:UDP-N-acetylmuramate dehydrogenase
MSFEQSVRTISGLEFLPDHDLTSLTTFKLAARGDLVEVQSVESLQKLLPLLKSEKKEFIVIGWGANQILPSTSQKIFIHLSFPFDPTYLESRRDHYVLPSSLGINHLTGHAIKFGLKGWEVFTGIPASLGGALVMNAGTNLGEIGMLVQEVKLVTTDGAIRTEKISTKSFSYRHNHFVKPGEVIIEATLKHLGVDELIPQKIKDYLEYRKKTQPLATKNCGCVFKNPHTELQSGRLIDLLGLKGIGVGGLRVSPKHANFMENTGSASWDHFKCLVDTINFEMDHFYGIEFELEVKIPYH